MALELPKKRIADYQIQLPQQRVPLDQILAVEGQNPVAQGISEIGKVVGQRMALRQQGDLIAKASKILGLPTPKPEDVAGMSVNDYVGLAEAKNRMDKDGPLIPPSPLPSLPLNTAVPGPSASLTPLGIPQPTAPKAPSLNDEVKKLAGGDYSTYQTLPKDKREELLKLSEISIRNQKQTAQDKQDRSRWDLLVKQSNPNTASSRSALGQATVGNAKALRAESVLSRPDATNQDLRAATTDMNSIFQGGVATDAGTHALEYQTLMGKLADLQTMLSSKPTAVATPEIKAHMASIIADLKDVNTKTINDNYDYEEITHPDLISKNKDAWDKMRQRMGAGKVSLQPLPGGGVDLGGGFSYKVKK